MFLLSSPAHSKHTKKIRGTLDENIPVRFCDANLKRQQQVIAAAPDENVPARCCRRAERQQQIIAAIPDEAFQPDSPARLKREQLLIAAILDKSSAEYDSPKINSDDTQRTTSAKLKRQQQKTCWHPTERFPLGSPANLKRQQHRPHRRDTPTKKVRSHAPFSRKI